MRKKNRISINYCRYFYVFKLKKKTENEKAHFAKRNFCWPHVYESARARALILKEVGY